MDLIDGESLAVDRCIAKANANNFRLIKIEENEFLQNLIFDYGGKCSKNSIWYKIHQYFNENKKHDEISALIEEIS